MKMKSKSSFAAQISETTWWKWLKYPDNLPNMTKIRLVYGQFELNGSQINMQNTEAIFPVPIHILRVTRRMANSKSTKLEAGLETYYLGWPQGMSITLVKEGNS